MLTVGDVVPLAPLSARARARARALEREAAALLAKIGTGDVDAARDASQLRERARKLREQAAKDKEIQQ